jgi:ABC-type sugar transport system substrate-binding protein
MKARSVSSRSSPAPATSIQREQGFKEGLKKFPKVKLVATLYSESDVTKGMQVTENMLTAHPDLKGIFAANEPGAIGAARVLQARKLVGKVKLVAFDAAPTEIKALQDGVIQALIVQNPFRMGYEGVKMAVKALRGRKDSQADRHGRHRRDYGKLPPPRNPTATFPAENQVTRNARQRGDVGEVADNPRFDAAATGASAADRPRAHDRLHAGTRPRFG